MNNIKKEEFKDIIINFLMDPIITKYQNKYLKILWHFIIKNKYFNSNQSL